MKLSYKTLGEGSPILMIHGYLENHQMWLPMAAELSKNHQVILPDLAGHGNSPVFSDSHTMDFQAEKIMEIIDELGVEKFTVIGHSMGGYIALALAENYSERVNGLCLFFSSSKADSDEKKKQRLETVEVAKKDRESYIRISVPKLFNPNKLNELKQEIEIAKSWAMDMPIEGIEAALKGMRERPDRTKILDEANYPIQIILGEFDGAVNAEEFKKVIPARENIKVDVLPVGHMGHLETPEISLQLIQNFLGKIT